MSGRRPIGFPARAVLDPAGLHMACVDIASHELHDPFLHETVQRMKAVPQVTLVPGAELGRLPASSAPAGLIFHVARCGSTLASQLLKQTGEFSVYAEPLAFNELLVPPHAVSRTELVRALRSLADTFAGHAGRPWVLKLTSWNILFCDVLAEAFPLTPWTLCLRDPLEVCVSLQERLPGWLRGDAAERFSSLVDPGRTAHSAEDSLALVFAAFCNAAGRLDRTRGLAVPYESLPGSVADHIAPHFGLQLAEPAKRRLATAAQTYSKAAAGQARVFVPDALRKRAAASAALCRAVDDLARPAYMRLIEGLGNPHSDLKQAPVR